MKTLFLDYFAVSQSFGYLLIFLGSFIEGDVVLLVAAFLARLHYLNFLIALGIVFAGAVFSNCFWFSVGRKYGESNNLFARWLHKHTRTISEKFENNLFKNYLFSKFTYGIHRFIIASIGAHSSISFKKYFKTDLLATLIWLVVIGGIGYGFAASYLILERYSKFIEVGFLCLLLFFMAGERILKHFAKFFEI